MAIDAGVLTQIEEHYGDKDDILDVLFEDNKDTSPILAMAEAGLYAIGVDTDQYDSLGAAGGNKALLTSAQKAIDVAVLDVINKNYGGDLGGEDYSGDLRNAGVLLAPYHDFDSLFSAELKAEVEAFRQDIFNGVFSTCDYLPAGC